MIVIHNDRWKQILKEILNRNDFVKISHLSKMFNVSNRTIRYDLDNIDMFLKNNNMPQLIRKPNAGIKYPDIVDFKTKSLELIGITNKKYYILSKDERIKNILSEVIRQKDYITIDLIAKKLDVSRSTIINDLAGVREWLSKFDLSLITVPKRGLIVSGEEKKLRKATVELLIETVDLEKALDFIESPLYMKYSTSINKQIKNLFDDIDIPYIEKCIEMLEKDLGTTFSDEAYSNLAIHLAIAIKRIQLGRKIIMPSEELNALSVTKEFKIASRISKYLEEHFNVQIPIDEIGYITVHLLGSSISATKINERENWLNLQILTGNVIKEVSSRINIDLKKDKQLFEGLKEHIRPAFYRLKHGLKSRNPLLEQIKSDYKELFKIVKESMAIVEQYLGNVFDDDEIGYITIHFAAAIERLKPENTLKHKILVVCGTGVGTAKLLLTRLKAVFDVDIVGAVAHHQVKNVLTEKCVDLVISTLPYVYEGVKTVRVNALLTDNDIDLLKKYIKNKKSIDKTIDQMIGIIKKNCKIENYERLIDDLSCLLNFKNNETIEEAIQPMFREIINEDNIKLNVEVKDWEEAVRAGGKLLEDNGYIKSEYIEAMINAVKEVGPYIVIAPGIAMPHARPELGAIKIGMSLITLKNPVDFGNKENDPVNIVICLCAIDHITHLKALSELVHLLKDEVFISTVLNSNDIKEIIRYINKNTEDNQ